MTMKAIFYDLDNTLYPQIEDIRQRVRACLRLGAISEVTGPEEFWLREWQENGPQKPDIIDKMITIFHPICPKEKLLEIYRTFPTILELPEKNRQFLNRMKRRGVFQFLITNGRRETQAHKISTLGLDSLLDEVIVSSGIYAKPSPACFHLCLERYDLQPAHCISVGDWYAIDGVASERCGIPFYYIEGGPVREEIPTGVPRIRTFTEIERLFG